jgi:hypothetical protein
VPERTVQAAEVGQIGDQARKQLLAVALVALTIVVPPPVFVNSSGTIITVGTASLDVTNLDNNPVAPVSPVAPVAPVAP